MAKKLNPDGIPTDIPSVNRKKRKTLFKGLGRGRKSKPAGQGSGDEPTAGPSRARPGGIFPDEPPTRPATRAPRRVPSATGSVRPRTDEPRTTIAGRLPRREAPHPGGAPETQELPGPFRPDARTDPVVGWLVVTGGPGKGSAIQIGNGHNSIGRGATARARIDFGDRQISRDTHAIVTYDPKHNRFYIQQGTGANLTYLEEDPVLAATPLKSGSTISLGATTLRFVALCNEDFSWQDRGTSQEQQ